MANPPSTTRSTACARWRLAAEVSAEVSAAEPGDRPAGHSPSSAGEPSRSQAQPTHPLGEVPSHLTGIPGVIEVVSEELAEPGDVTSNMLANALGGWRGMIDSSIPTAMFVIAYLVTAHDLRAAIWAAVIAGALMAIWRLARRQSVQQVLGGFGGVAISAFVAAKTESAANFYLPGLLTNVAYGAAFLISALVGWPLVGLGVGAFLGDIKGWRKVAPLRRAYTVVTLGWAALFWLKVAVQVPLYLLNLVGPLGVAKIAMGLPLTAVGAWLSYRVLRPELARAQSLAPKS